MGRPSARPAAALAAAAAAPRAPVPILLRVAEDARRRLLRGRELVPREVARLGRRPIVPRLLIVPYLHRRLLLLGEHLTPGRAVEGDGTRGPAGGRCLRGRRRGLQRRDVDNRHIWHHRHGRRRRDGHELLCLLGQLRVPLVHRVAEDARGGEKRRREPRPPCEARRGCVARVPASAVESESSRGRLLGCVELRPRALVLAPHHPAGWRAAPARQAERRRWHGLRRLALGDDGGDRLEHELVERVGEQEISRRTRRASGSEEFRVTRTCSLLVFWAVRKQVVVCKCCLRGCDAGLMPSARGPSHGAPERPRIVALSPCDTRARREHLAPVRDRLALRPCCRRLRLAASQIPHATLLGPPSNDRRTPRSVTAAPAPNVKCRRVSKPSPPHSSRR